MGMNNLSLFDYYDIQTLHPQSLVWLEHIGNRWESTDAQYWDDATAYAKWQKLGGNEWMKVQDDPRLSLSTLMALVDRGWAEIEKRKWWNTELECLQAHITPEGIDAFQRLRIQTADAYFAWLRKQS